MPTPIAAAIALAAALVAVLGTVSADSLWLAALGGTVADTGGVPDGVPFAAAESSHWPNVLVLAELALHLLVSGLDDRGLLLAQVAAVAACFAVLGIDMRRSGAGDVGAAAVIVAIVPAGLSALVAIRVQLFSLPLFALLALLLRAERRNPTRGIWLVVPLLALWSNLHGAALVGLAVAGAYLVLDRSRRSPVTAVAVLAASAVAVCLTPALLRTPSYYAGVLENEAARRGVGLWAPVSVGSALDLLLVVGAIALLALAIGARPPLWELAALGGLTLLTIQTARSGIWLLLLAAVPAARALRLDGRLRPRIAAAAIAVLAAVAAAGVVRGPIRTDAGDHLIAAAVEEAAGTPILAEPLLAEQIALAGGRIWVGNPIDAFDRQDQRLYLDWAEGAPDGDAALDRVPRVVLVQRNGEPQRRLARSAAGRELARDDHAVLYVKTTAG